MPSFVCDTCQETLKKAKLDQHAQRCRRAVFSCIDCYKTFASPAEYRAHVSCITEEEKYHGGKEKKQQQQQPNEVQKIPTKIEISKTETSKNAQPKPDATAHDHIDEAKSKNLNKRQRSESSVSITSLLSDTPISGIKLRKLLRKERKIGKSEATQFLLKNLIFSVDHKGRYQINFVEKD